MSAGSPLSKSIREQYVDIFRAMAEPLRVEIISLFEEDQCACTVLEERLPVSKSTISYHIKTLNQAGLVDVRKEGRFYHYQLRREVFDFFLPSFLDRLMQEKQPTASVS